MFDPFETTESQMTIVTGRPTDEAQIRALVENRVKAVHAKDLSAATANIAPKDYVQFGVVNPLQITGAETMRDRARAWFAAYQGPIGFEIRDLSITAGEDVAFCHYFYHVSGTMNNGGKNGHWEEGAARFPQIGGHGIGGPPHQFVPSGRDTREA